MGTLSVAFLTLKLVSSLIEGRYGEGSRTLRLNMHFHNSSLGAANGWASHIAWVHAIALRLDGLLLGERSIWILFDLIHGSHIIASFLSHVIEHLREENLWLTLASTATAIGFFLSLLGDHFEVLLLLVTHGFDLRLQGQSWLVYNWLIRCFGDSDSLLVRGVQKSLELLLLLEGYHAVKLICWALLWIVWAQVHDVALFIITIAFTTAIAILFTTPEVKVSLYKDFLYILSRALWLLVPILICLCFSWSALHVLLVFVVLHWWTFGIHIGFVRAHVVFIFQIADSMLLFAAHINTLRLYL